MSRADQDRYFAESGEIARLLDADPVPRTRAEAERLIGEFRAELRADDRTRAFRDLVLEAPAASIGEAPVQSLLMNAAVDLMPDFARDMHGLPRPLLPPAGPRRDLWACAARCAGPSRASAIAAAIDCWRALGAWQSTTDFEWSLDECR